jgi:hypothetical protein
MDVVNEAKFWSVLCFHLEGVCDEKNWQRNCHHSIKHIAFLVICFFLSGCIAKNYITVTFYPKKIPFNITVSKIQIINNQLVITGTNLNTVSSFNIKEESITSALQIESKTSTSIIANIISNVSFASEKLFDFILSNASGEATYQVSFTMLNGKFPKSSGIHKSSPPKYS